MTFKDEALKYASYGWAVFPLRPHDKVPMTHHGCKEATTDITQIKRWWNRSPEANIGIATGSISGGLVVIDLDIDEGKGLDGYETLKDWERDHAELPETVSSITGRGGYHYYFHSTEVIKNRAGLLDGIDVRGEGGYVVAPPSIHKNGNPYEWEYDPSEYSIAEANSVVLELINQGKKPQESTTKYEDIDVRALIKEGGRNQGLYKVGCHYQSKYYPDWEVTSLMHQINDECCQPPLDDDEMDKLIASVLSVPKGKSEEFKHRKHDKNTQKIQDIVDEVHQDEELNGAIRYNTLAYSPWIAGKLPWSELTQREWTDVDDSQFLAYMEKEYNFYKKENVMRALDIVQDENKFNPVVEHLESLKWDGKPRQDTLLIDYLGCEDTRLNREIIKMYMNGAIARVLEPGCQFDYMLVLVGDQGVGKSTFLRRLAMVDNWFDGNFGSVEGSAAIERLRGNWIVEMSELLALKRTKDVEAIKSFITNRFDNFRAPYARRTTQRPRMCVFAGTTNNKQFLSDPTGNRRFMPVETHIDRAKLDLQSKDAPEHFEQAWAEAYAKYKQKKPKLVFSKEGKAMMEKHQEDFTEEDVRIGMIQEFLNTTTKSMICAMDVWVNALDGDVDKITKKITKEIHTILREQTKGWHNIGRHRCKYGLQTCYERDGFVQASESEEKIPF